MPLSTPASALPESLDLRLPSPVQRVVRAALLILIFIWMAFWLSVGTIESRILYGVLFGLAFSNVSWGFLLLAMLGPLFLQDMGKVHILMGVDVLTVGLMAGALREWRPSGTGRRSQVVHYGVWPHFLIGLFFLLFASSFVGLQLVWLRENFVDGLSGLGYRWLQMYVGTASEPEWALRSLWNWTTGMLLAVVAARRMDEIMAARWLKIGAISMAVACVFSLLDWAAGRFPGWTGFNLNGLRLPNPDPLQNGRLQGTAGHPGWFAQWIVLMWPGLLLWWSPSRNKRNAVVLAGVFVCGLAMVLSAARAGWLGMIVSLGIAFIFMMRHYPALKAKLPWLIGVAVAVMVIALAIGGEYLWFRLDNILRAQDRANYYVTGLTFLRLFPFGLGLGTHYRFYGWMIPPDYRWGQEDFVDSHNLLLHTLVENGPFVPIMIVLGAVGLAIELRRAWPQLLQSQREILGCMALALIGIAVVSIAQYIVYIRVVELGIWVMAGTVIGICRSRCALHSSPLESPRGRRILLACGVGAALMASMNAHRVYADEVPRIRDYDDQGRLAVWTGLRWQVAVEGDVDYIAFNLYRRALATDVTVTWPDGTVEHHRMEPGPLSTPLHDREAGLFLERHFQPREARWYQEPGWLKIEVSSLWTPAEVIPDATDTRGLGVYISGLRLDSDWRRALEAERAAAEAAEAAEDH